MAKYTDLPMRNNSKSGLTKLRILIITPEEEFDAIIQSVEQSVLPQNEIESVVLALITAWIERAEGTSSEPFVFEPAAKKRKRSKDRDASADGDKTG